MRTEQNRFPAPKTNGRPHLTPEQHELLKGALGLKVPDDRSNADFRPVLREIINGCESIEPPEQVLVAFKNSLDEVANGARIPLGPERNVRLSSLVSAFIEEMYARQPVIRDGACRGK
jgi:hypothetical protein